ncbi:TPA: hypothetical protein ACOTG0_002053 [Clostridium perfringens]|nr:hypothetical protein phiCPD_00057 [Clostridium phage phiCp-D]
MVLLTVLNILVCAGTLVTVLAAKREIMKARKEIDGLGKEVTELYDIVEETESAVYRTEDKVKGLEKGVERKFLEVNDGISFMIDGNEEMYGLIEKIDKAQVEDLKELKEFIVEEHGKLHMKIAFTPLKVVQVGGQDGRA